MDVYVESNFVMELALLQEQHESCERIVELCEAGKSRLILPAYSLVEPHETLIGRAKERSAVSKKLTEQVQQLSRSKPYQEETTALERVSGILVRSSDEDKERLRQTVGRLLAVADIISFNAQTLGDAIRHQRDRDLSFQDSIVYASVLSHLKASTTAAKCFLNRDRKDFDDPDIEETLNSRGCKMLFSFDQGYRYITRPAKQE